MSDVELPEHVVEEILFRLSAKEVVGSSVLSRAWHRRWQWAPVLSFCQDAPAAAIDKVLLAHSAPIQGLSIDHVKDKDGAATEYIDRWLVLLSRRHPDALTSLCLLFSPMSKPPISSLVLSSFQSLTCLSLKDCSLSPPPVGGLTSHCLLRLPLLRTLILSCVSFSGRHHLSALISGCPSLEDLSLSYLQPFGCLRIHNPNLRSLHVECFAWKDIAFAAADGGQILEKVSLRGRAGHKEPVDLAKLFGNSAVCNGTLDVRGIRIESKSTPFHFHSHLQQLKVLTMKEAFGSSRFAPPVEPFRFQPLTVLTMDVDWRYMSSIQLFLSLIRSAPNLQQLHLAWQRGADHTDLIRHYFNQGLCPPEDFEHQDFWNQQQQQQQQQSMNHHRVVLDKLRTVEMLGTLFTVSEMGCMQFLLAITPALQKLTVVGADGPLPLLCKPALQVLNKYCHGPALQLLNMCHKASPQTQIQITTISDY